MVAKTSPAKQISRQRLLRYFDPNLVAAIHHNNWAEIHLKSAKRHYEITRHTEHRKEHSHSLKKRDLNVATAMFHHKEAAKALDMLKKHAPKAAENKQIHAAEVKRWKTHHAILGASKGFANKVVDW